MGCGLQDSASATGDRPSQQDTEQSVAALTACSQESDCIGSLACVAGACQPCSAHRECQSDVCDRYAATSEGPGKCLKEAEVVYTTASGGPGCETGDGTRTNPACSIRRAIPLSSGGRYAIRVYPGHYFPFAVSQRTVYLFGPGDGSVQVGEEDDSAGARITQGSRVVLDGLDFGVAVITGLIIQDSDVQVRNATVKGDFRGITSSNSTLRLDRVRVSGADRGLRVDGAGTYRITNSYFRSSGFPAVAFTGPSSGSFLFNTVLGGGFSEPGGIDCGTTPRLIRDSIVFGSVPGPEGAQTVGACNHERVVVGSGDTRVGPGLIKIDPDLDADGRLLGTAANAACCIDRGARFVSSLYTDFFGTPRPQGASNDIGAFERLAWQRGRDTPVPREGYGAAAVNGIIYYIAGHGLEEGSVADLRINQAYDPSLDSWSPRAPLPPLPRAEMSAVSDGRYVYLVGGRIRAPASVSSELWRYDPSNDSWLQLASMPTPRATEYMAAFEDGRIYVVGGRATGQPGGGRELDVVEAYDIAGGNWEALAPLPQRRSDALVLAQNGHLYVFGGYAPLDVTTSAKTDTTFIYDIVGDSWTQGANLPFSAPPSEFNPNGARVNLTGAVCLGKLHVIGGSGPVTRDSMNTNNWVYDPIANSWRDEEPIPGGTTEVQAVSTGGKIHVVGGGVLSNGVNNPINQIFTCH